MEFDATRKRSKIDALRDSAAFDALLDAAVDAIIVIDSKGIIEIFNRAATQIFGYLPAEVTGQNVRMLMDRDHASSHDRYIGNYLRTGEKHIIGIGREVTARRKDGDVFPIELSVGEVTFGNTPRFVGIIRDISARKIAEAELRQQRDRLAHVTRLSTLGEMAAGIAHEVNQPLTAIATYANACRRVASAPEPDLEDVEDMLGKISAQALRAGEVIRRLRTFVKQRGGEYEHTSLNELVRDIVTLAEIDAHQSRIALKIELTSENVPVLADAVQIQQVLLKLVRNAIEAVAGSGESDTSVVVRTFRDDDNATVEVVDSGPGIDASFRDKLFTPFLTTKSFGMGLGLSISRSIVTAHKGELQFRENPAGGSVFYFNLPLARGESET